MLNIDAQEHDCVCHWEKQELDTPYIQAEVVLKVMEQMEHMHIAAPMPVYEVPTYFFISNVYKEKKKAQ